MKTQNIEGMVCIVRTGQEGRKLSIVTISDIHIKNNEDSGAILLQAFFDNKLVKESHSVYFLGDIFDLMIGPHQTYFKRYAIFFEGIKKLFIEGKKVYFVSGNHDFHLEKLFEIFLNINKIDKNQFTYSTKKLCHSIEGHEIFFSHGDDIELGNPSYKRYKKIISSFPIKYLANYIVPYKILSLIGETASKISRKKNNSTYVDNPNTLRDIKHSFRDAAEIVAKNSKLDLIICGHSHIEDDFTLSNKARYLNNGYFPESQKFIFVDKNHAKLISLRT